MLLILFNIIYFMLDRWGSPKYLKILEIRAASRAIISQMKCNIHMALHSLSIFPSFFKHHQVYHPQPKCWWQNYQT